VTFLIPTISNLRRRINPRLAFLPQERWEIEVLAIDDVGAFALEAASGDRVEWQVVLGFLGFKVQGEPWSGCFRSDFASGGGLRFDGRLRLFLRRRDGWRKIIGEAIGFCRVAQVDPAGGAAWWQDGFARCRGW
jgi:hypothetical protein